jgi:hypothetical protein
MLTDEASDWYFSFWDNNWNKAASSNIPIGRCTSKGWKLPAKSGRLNKKIINVLIQGI